MRNLFYLMLVLPLSLFAQNDDMFYVPKREIKQSDVAKVLSAADEEWDVTGSGNYRNVDEYNRRGTYARTAEPEVAEVYPEEYYEEEVYDYSTRIVRFHNPTIVVGNPYYWNVYPAGVRYASWYDTYWGLSYYDGYWGLGLGASYYWPSLYPHYHSHWHPAPHYPHNGVAARPARVVRGRIPVASVGSNANKVNRVPVSQAGNKNNRKPAGSAQTAEKKSNTGSAVKSEGRKPGSRQKVERTSGSESVTTNTKASRSTTYNRPSSTGVRRQSSTGGERRTPVGTSGGSRSRSGGRR